MFYQHVDFSGKCKFWLTNICMRTPDLFQLSLLVQFQLSLLIQIHPLLVVGEPKLGEYKFGNIPATWKNHIDFLDKCQHRMSENDLFHLQKQSIYLGCFLLANICRILEQVFIPCEKCNTLGKCPIFGLIFYTKIRKKV